MLENTDDDGAAIESEMPDLTGYTLGDLEKIRRPSLDHALRRVLAENDHTADPVVAFQAGI
jgi:FXSXX-COOH protein